MSGSREVKKIVCLTIFNPGHDFFGPQPVKDADIWVLRSVLHDWATPYAAKILKQLRAATTPGKGRLLMIDTVVDYACDDVPDSASGITGAAKPLVSHPLLPNLGRASATSYLLDIQYVLGHSQSLRQVS